MAKAGFIKTIKKNIPFKNISTNFLYLVLLFILSILMFFVFNKYNVETLRNNITLEVTLIGSYNNTTHKFIRDNAFAKLKQEYNKRKKEISFIEFKSFIEFRHVNDVNKYRIPLNEPVSKSHFPMVVFSTIAPTTKNKVYVSRINSDKLDASNVRSKIKSFE